MSVHNLNHARKRKTKAAAVKQADANRIIHGLSAAQRKAAKTTLDTQTKAVDDHKIDGR